MNEKSTLKPDEIRKAIWELSQKGSKLQSRLMSPSPMIEGCIHNIYKKCGNPKCYCAVPELDKVSRDIDYIN